MPTLVVQMGHVGRTSGATGAPGEQDFTARVGEACRRLLSGHGWGIRTIGADVSLDSYRGDAFAAVHADGNNNPNVRGSSVGYQTAPGGDLAHGWRHYYVALGWQGPWNGDNYTVNLAQYYGVTNAVRVGNTRAFIAECGTITNPTERAAMTSQQGIDRVALAIGYAVGIPIPPQEEDMALSDDPNFAALIWRMEALIWGRATVAKGPTAGEKVQLNLDLAKIVAGVGELSDDEAHILAAIRALPEPGDVDEEALAAALAPLLAPLLNTGATPEQVEAAVRRVFADAGQAD